MEKTSWVDNRSGITYNTIVKMYHIVLDTNVLIAALRFKKGAAHRLLMLLGDKRFKIHLSVPLVLEYEDAAKRLTNLTSLTAGLFKSLALGCSRGEDLS